MMPSLRRRAAWLLLASCQVLQPATASTVRSAAPALAGAAAASQAAPAAGQELPAVQFVRSGQRVLDRAGSVRVLVELSRPAGKQLSIPLAVSGSAVPGLDVRAPAWRIPVPAGETRGELVIEVVGLPRTEWAADVPDKTLALSLQGVRGVRLGAQRTHVLALGNTQLGDPLPGLTPDEQDAFDRGRLVFDRRFKPSEGLGPFYNATSCASCHSTPVSGGASGLYRNFFLAVYQFGSTPATQSTSIPPFLSQVLPAFGSGEDHATSDFTLEGGRPLLPDTVFGFPVIAAQRNAIPIFGTGLFEFISDDDIEANADPTDVDGDGISGEVNTQLSGSAVGRFGSKAQVNNIELFTRAPLMNQMGITSDPFEGDDAVVGLMRFQTSTDPNDPTIDADGVPDPEISTDDLGDLIAFTRFLAPPLPKPFSPQALRGESFFADVGCTACHLPSLPSSRGPVDAYTDLLLHDMGPDLVDNIRLGDNFQSLTEFRTQPLWGLSQVGPYMHDGRAATIDEAIVMHAGEAQASRDAYVALPQDRRDAIIAFLEHL